ncbi:MAG: hypothetical protein C5B48_03555 [Candidatus Rokuibacteriota bacterium]|nr:MAG: hypothetical protein C5B48_03555 [Candidatus Rokubacteria bacterium]
MIVHRGRGWTPPGAPGAPRRESCATGSPLTRSRHLRLEPPRRLGLRTLRPADAGGGAEHGSAPPRRPRPDPRPRSRDRRLGAVGQRLVPAHRGVRIRPGFACRSQCRLLPPLPSSRPGSRGGALRPLRARGNPRLARSVSSGLLPPAPNRRGAPRRGRCTARGPLPRPLSLHLLPDRRVQRGPLPRPLPRCVPARGEEAMGRRLGRGRPGDAHPGGRCCTATGAAPHRLAKPRAASCVRDLPRRDRDRLPVSDLPLARARRPARLRARPASVGSARFGRRATGRCLGGTPSRLGWSRAADLGLESSQPLARSDGYRPDADRPGEPLQPRVPRPLRVPHRARLAAAGRAVRPLLCAQPRAAAKRAERAVAAPVAPETRGRGLSLLPGASGDRWTTPVAHRDPGGERGTAWGGGHPMGALAVGRVVPLAAGCAALVALVAGTACGERSEPTGTSVPLYPVTVSGAAGRPLRVSAPAHRIVVLSPSLLETLDRLGARRRVVGMPLLPNGSIQIDRLAHLHPDLIVAPASTDDVQLSRAAAATHAGVYVAPQDSIPEVEQAITELGLISGAPVAARRLVHRIEASRQLVHRRLDSAPNVTVFFDTGLLTPAANQSLTGDLITEAHGSNVAGQTAHPIEPSNLLSLDPRFFLTTSDSGTTFRDLRRNSVLRKLRAVRSHRFGVIPPGVLDPGPRIGDGLLAVARLLHPDAFR